RFGTRALPDLRERVREDRLPTDARIVVGRQLQRLADELPAVRADGLSTLARERTLEVPERDLAAGDRDAARDDRGVVPGDREGGTPDPECPCRIERSRLRTGDLRVVVTARTAGSGCRGGGDPGGQQQAANGRSQRLPPSWIPVGCTLSCPRGLRPGDRLSDRNRSPGARDDAVGAPPRRDHTRSA